MEKLAIVNLNKNNKTSKSPFIPEHLPQPPMRLVVIGSSNLGKSNMIKNMITRDDEFGYKNHFGGNIIIFSKTLGLDSTWSTLKHPKSHLYREWDEEIVKKIMDYSKKQTNGVLLLLDDLISDANAFNKKNSNLLTELFYTGRHYKISLCITSQRLHAVPSGMLSNCSQMCVFALKTKRERESFLEIVNNFEDLPRKYEYAVREPYSFIYLNLQTGKAYRNFEEQL